MSYSSQFPWDTTPLNGASSLALIDAALDNELASSWRACISYGTPGQENFPDTAVNSKSNENVPAEYMLNQNYPNPFNGSTWIVFQLPYKTRVKIILYDLRGRWIEELIDSDFSAGIHSIPWRADERASGLYFYQILAGDFKQTKRLILQK